MAEAAIRTSTELAAREIEELHSFLQNWFRGDMAPTQSAFERISLVWPPPFEIIGPDGRLRTSGEVLADTFAEHGCYPDLTIRIENLRVHEIASGAAVIACYEEWHTDSQGIDPRLCSATLVRPDVRADHIVWMHIHESVLADRRDHTLASDAPQPSLTTEAGQNAGGNGS